MSTGTCFSCAAHPQRSHRHVRRWTLSPLTTKQCSSFLSCVPDLAFRTSNISLTRDVSGTLRTRVSDSGPAAYKLTGGMPCRYSLASASRTLCFIPISSAAKTLRWPIVTATMLTANGHLGCAHCESQRSVRVDAHCSPRTMMTISITAIRPWMTFTSIQL